MKKFLKLCGALLFSLLLTGCEFNPYSFSDARNRAGIIFGVIVVVAGLIAVVAAIVSVFYKGKIYMVKVLKKREIKNKNKGGFRVKGAHNMSRISHSKIDMEIDGKKKTIKCTDYVLLDKLSVGRIHKVRIRFNTINKIYK